MMPSRPARSRREPHFLRVLRDYGLSCLPLKMKIRVNAIDGAHTPYLVHFTDVSRSASQDAAAAVAAHEVLVTLYPQFQTQLDEQLLQVLAQIPQGADKAPGISIGKADDERICAQPSS